MILFALAFVVYCRTIDHSFLPYDDDKYVYANPHVTAGLTLEGTAWALTSLEYSNWHPLTWMSHMTDVTLFGVGPSGPHATSLVLHGVNTILLFLLFLAMTERLPESGIVAALFAVHPLHVESVAWVAERKELLCTFFFLLALGAYVRYTRNPSRIRFVPVVALFTAALLCKAMAVTFPFVLLLLDYWPLGRIRTGSGEFRDLSGLAREKIPLFVLSAASCVIVFIAQDRGGSVDWNGRLPLGTRLANAGMAYVGYLRKSVWPSDLAVLYPFDAKDLVAWKVSGAILLLLSVSALAIRSIRNRPWFAVGWFWYLGTLVPVIGIVQIGLHSMADRYTYLPLVGIFVVFSWGLREAFGTEGIRERVAETIVVLIIAVFMTVSWFQVGRWKDSVTLYRYALSITRDNWVMHTNLGGELLTKEGKVDEAIVHFREALRINPRCWEAHYELSRSLAYQGKKEEADAHRKEAFTLWNLQRAHP
jgi:hypothetical protein